MGFEGQDGPNLTLLRKMKPSSCDMRRAVFALLGRTIPHRLRSHTQATSSRLPLYFRTVHLQVTTIFIWASEVGSFCIALFEVRAGLLLVETEL